MYSDIKTTPPTPFMEITFKSWKEFYNYLLSEYITKQIAFYWRGQRRQDWSLATTFDRLYETRSTPNLTKEKALKQQFAKFIFAIRGKQGAPQSSADTLNDPDKQNEIWALGQHHGLATPLLDWTLSPFVAAYFAFEEATPEHEQQNDFRAIWVVERSPIREKMRDLQKSPNFSPVDHPEEIISLSIDNPRLISQSGILVRMPEKTLNDWINTHLGVDYKKCIFAKLLVPEPEREIILRSLNMMNINRSTLFPDLDGAASFTNTYFEIERY